MRGGDRRSFTQIGVRITCHIMSPHTFRAIIQLFHMKTLKSQTLKNGLFLGFRLPVPRPGQVLGLVGTNGIGKSTALKVLAGKLKPNLGRFAVTWGGWGGWRAGVLGG